MKLFLKDNRGYIFIYLFSVILTIFYCILMNFFKFSETIYIILFNTSILLCFLGVRYYKNREVYRLFSNGVNNLNESFKNLGDSILGKNISNILKMYNKLYEGEVQKLNKSHSEHLTFMNHWVHQMKTPVSVIGLQLQEYEGEEIFDDISNELIKINKGLNMAMYFARLSSFQKDFVCETIFLKEVVIEKINEEKKLFIKNSIIPQININEDIKIYSDKKWMKFVIEQIITNGVKYSKSKGKILFIYAREEEKSVTLEIIDKGVGIPKKDIKRVFDPFFTGENGRKFGESTGMGLYLVKRICENLNHRVLIESKEGQGTKVSIVFNK